MSSDKLTKSLLETLKSGSLMDLSKDAFEVSIDQLLSDGILKDIPIVGTISNVFGITNSINNYLFTKKLLRFLYGIKDIPQKQREKMISKIDDNLKYREKIGEYLLFLINHCEDDNKAGLLSWGFRSFLQDKVSFENFQRIANIINHLSLIDFKDFINTDVFGEDRSIYIGCGLLFVYSDTPSIERGTEYEEPDFFVDGGETNVCVTDIGYLMKEIYKDYKYGTT
jgi:hypothetical protein